MFALATVTLASCGAVLALVIVDVYLHSRYERTAAVNVWGYRGPTIGRKQPRERRVAYLGGSSAFGYGVLWNEAVPAQLEHALNARPGLPHISVVNLAFNNEGAYAFKPTLDDYRYLAYDVVCLYEGYNDLLGDEHPNRLVSRRDSPVFRLTGYFPIFPMVFREKAAAIRYGGNIDAMYRAGPGGEVKTVFRPGVAGWAIAGTLDAAVTVSRSLEGQLARLADVRPQDRVDDAAQRCAFPWSGYCRSIFEAVDDALAYGARALVITQPYLTGKSGERHRDQQRALSAALLRQYAGDARVRYVDLGAAIDLADRSLAYDGMHLTPDGNRVVAARLADPVAAAIRQ